MAKPKKGGRPGYKKKPVEQKPLKSWVEPAKPTQESVQECQSHDGQLAEQKRAQYALKTLKEALANSSDESDFRHSELKAYVRRLPSMIQINGFGQAMAFYYAKSSMSGKTRNNADNDKKAADNAYGVVYRLVENWLCQGDQVYAETPSGMHPLLTAITENDQQRYRAAQAETHALMRWVKKFAEALIVKNDENS